jgi:hypothetical protein
MSPLLDFKFRPPWYLRSHFHDVTQRIVAIRYRRFGTIYRSHLQRSRNPSNFWSRYHFGTRGRVNFISFLRFLSCFPFTSDIFLYYLPIIIIIIIITTNTYLLTYLLSYLLQLSFRSVAVILTLGQTKQIRLNIHKQNHTKKTVQTIQNTINTSTHITKTPTQLSKKSTHYKTI